MSYTYLQEREAGYLEECSSDTPQFALWKSNPTGADHCSNASETEYCQGSQSGMMSELLTENHGAEESMPCAEGSRARTLAVLERAPGLTGTEAGSGSSMPGLLAKYDPATHSLKTAQGSLFSDLIGCSVTLPQWGMMQGGACYPLPTPSGILATRARITFAIESGYSHRFQTPTVQDAHGRDRHNQKSGGVILSLLGQVRRYPTPASNNGTGGCTGLAGGSGNRQKLYKMFGKEEGKKLGCQSINPNWEEWLMWWPIGWTDLQPLGMAKFQQWLRSHGEYSAKDYENPSRRPHQP
jgi:hypothetical protein